MGRGPGLTRKSFARDPVRLPSPVKKVLERGEGALLVRMNDGYGEDTYGIVEVHKGGRTIIRHQDSERNIRQLWREEKWGKTRRDPQRDSARTYYLVSYRTRFESTPSYGDTHDFKRFSDKGQAIAFRNRIVKNGGEATLRKVRMTATEARMSRGTNARFRKSYPGADPFIDSKRMERVNSRERRRAGRWHKRMSGSSRDLAGKKSHRNEVKSIIARKSGWAFAELKTGEFALMQGRREGLVIIDADKDQRAMYEAFRRQVRGQARERRRQDTGRDPQKLETLKHYSGKALLKLLKQAQAKGDEETEEAIGAELDKRAKRYGFARDAEHEYEVQDLSTGKDVYVEASSPAEAIAKAIRKWPKLANARLRAERL